MTGTSWRVKAERFRETVSVFFRLHLLGVTQRPPLDSLATAIRDRDRQASDLLVGDHFSVTTSTAHPLRPSGLLREAKSAAMLDGRSYYAVVTRKHGEAAAGEQLVLLDLDTFTALIEQIEQSGDHG